LVTKVVNDEAGTIDKFIGDGVMAFWGAPALLEDHAWRACLAALRIEQGMTVLNERWVEEGHKALNVRIGINSDAVLVGNIGSKERMGYTVIGDGVNIAARLEGLNKEYGTHICISHSVFKEAGERLCVRPIEDVAVRGRRAKIPVYELRGAYGAGPQCEPDPAGRRHAGAEAGADASAPRAGRGVAAQRIHRGADPCAARQSRIRAQFRRPRNRERQWCRARGSRRVGGCLAVRHRYRE